MIQDIGQSVYHVEYLPEAPADQDVVFLFQRGKIFAFKDEAKQLHFATYESVKDQMNEEHLQYLFGIDEKRYYLYDGEMHLQHFDFEKMGYVRIMQDMKEAFAAMTAYHLYTWYSSHRFCGKCGEQMAHSDQERVLICPDCGNRVYPGISPAVIIGVTRGDDILVTRYADREYKGVALLAGFCEIGESGEDTVCREVMEEVGLKVKNIRYYASQPWGIDSNLLIGYFAEVDGSTEIHMDVRELKEAVWMPRKELKPAKNVMSLTMTMIEAFRKGEI